MTIFDTIINALQVVNDNVVTLNAKVDTLLGMLNAPAADHINNNINIDNHEQT